MFFFTSDSHNGQITQKCKCVSARLSDRRENFLVDISKATVISIFISITWRTQPASKSLKGILRDEVVAHPYTI